MMAEESHLEFFFLFNHLDNSSFNLALYELSHGSFNFNSNRLETLLFNPIEQPELSNSLSTHLNPDSNFIAALPSSSYLAEDDINSRVTPLSDKINFSITHLNAWSLLKDLDQLNLMLGSLKNHSLWSVFQKRGWLIALQSWLISLDTILSQTIANPKQVAEWAFIYKTTFITNFLMNANCQIERQLSLYSWRLQFPMGKNHFWIYV